MATFAAACGLFLAGAIALLWGSGRAGPAVEWMNIYRLGDIRSFGGGLDFVLGLRVPIPPNLALVEIAEHRLTGDTRLATGLLYHAYVAVAYLCVLLLAYPHRVRLVVSTVLALLFVAGTRLIHPGNPQLYDVAAPCFFLLFVLLLRVGTETTRPRLAVAALVGAGFFLAMFDMTRPYVVLLLPVILVCAGVRIASRQRLLWFLLPVVLLSGAWHGHLVAAYGQLTSSNHSGVNLWRCWYTGGRPFALPVPEENAPLAAGRWANLNNPQHAENSRILRNRVVRFAVTHPGQSARFIGKRLVAFTGATGIYGHRPQSWVLAIYSPAARVASFVVLVGFLVLCGRLVWLLVRRRDGVRSLLGATDTLLIVVGATSMLIMAVSEVHEEARFMISVLPLLAAVPWVDGLRPRPERQQPVAAPPPEALSR